MAALPAKPPLKGEVPAKRAEGFAPPRRKVAAALSAAVTTTKQQETAPTSQAEPSQKNRTLAKRQPLFGREREGGASLREAASLAFPLHASFFLDVSRRGGIIHVYV